MVREAAAAFAADEPAPRVQRACLEETADPEMFQKMGARGLLGVTPNPGRDMAAPARITCSHGLVAREIERIHSGYRSMMSVQSSLVMHPISRLRVARAAAEIFARSRLRRVDRLLLA